MLSGSEFGSHEVGKKSTDRDCVIIPLKNVCTYVLLEPVCCKKQQKKFLTSYWFVE
jgi:hypothetical protein